jgi:hypothetical protein
MLYPRLESVSDLPGWLLTELAFYGVAAGMLAGVIVGAILAVSLVTSRVSGSQRLLTAGRRLAMVCVAAFVLGAPASLAFTAAMRYHFYVPGDPIVDWLPFIPSGAWVIDPAFGGRFVNGGSPWLLRWAWLILAVPVWSGAVVVERHLARSRNGWRVPS